MTRIYGQKDVAIAYEWIRGNRTYRIGIFIKPLSPWTRPECWKTMNIWQEINFAASRFAYYWNDGGYFHIRVLWFCFAYKEK